MYSLYILYLTMSFTSGRVMNSIFSTSKRKNDFLLQGLLTFLSLVPQRPRVMRDPGPGGTCSLRCRRRTNPSSLGVRVSPNLHPRSQVLRRSLGIQRPFYWVRVTRRQLSRHVVLSLSCRLVQLQNNKRCFIKLTKCFLCY